MCKNSQNYLLTVIKLCSFLWVGENFLGRCDIDELLLRDFLFTLVLGEVVGMPKGRNNSLKKIHF